jgi:hypothetical protein
MDLAMVVAALDALDLEHAPPGALGALLAACAGTATRIAVYLATTSSPEPPTSTPETFVSVKVAAVRLGVSPRWLYRRRKTLPFMREMVPGTWRVSVPALERWMHRRRRP